MKKKIVIVIILLSILVIGITAILFYRNRTKDRTMYALINEKGERITGYKFISVNYCSENGLILVEDIFGKFGYIDCEGKYVIRPQFEAATDFENGYAYVTKTSFTLKGNKTEHGYIDETGKIVIPGKEQEQFKFAANGLAVTRSQDTSYGDGYVDKSGEYVIPPVYSLALDFADNGLAAVGRKMEKMDTVILMRQETM